MASKLKSIPRGLWPHHDGSALYVTNQKPQLLDKVKIKIRVHSSFGKVKSIRVRFSESGEAFPTPPAKLISTKGGWSWYEATIVMHNPYMNYRWYLEFTDGTSFWLNARGLSDLEQPDVEDFRINTFSSAPAWAKSAVMYQIFPDRFGRSSQADKHKTPEWALPRKWSDKVIASGPGTSEQFFGGDLYGVIEHLDHLKKLGVTLIYLTPVFPARSNHRYDASSFDEVDPLLGGDKALVELVQAAHKKGFKIIGDLTSNHSGSAHQWFKAAYKKPGAKESEFYYFSNKNRDYDSWFGVPSLPKFNWKSQELRKRFITGPKSIVAKWLKPPYNMDGWRIDVANMTGRIREEDMYLEIQKLMRETIQSINPNAVVLGEYTGDAAYQMQGEGWHGAMTYYNFTKPVWRWFYNPKVKAEAGFLGIGRTKIDGFEMVKQHMDFAAGFPWHVRLHNMNPLDTHDIPRFKTFTISGAQRVAAGMQFTFPGMPVIWAGDEFGLDGTNGEESRTPIPWNNERANDRVMLSHYQEFARIRKENSALHDGSMRFVYVSKELVAYIRENAKQSILVVASRGADNSASIPLDSVPGISEAQNLYGGAKLKVVGQKVILPGAALSVNIWRLPAAR
ncbi:MAG: glycoside hydrolase family 13 protein [Microbacteriaceae bacterium]|nr:glycoside hydrolase family 13 protein [Microbacteriaceae bacterium]